MKGGMKLSVEQTSFISLRCLRVRACTFILLLLKLSVSIRKEIHAKERGSAE